MEEIDSIEKSENRPLARRLIYVDASRDGNHQCKISLYDKEKSATHVLQLKDIDKIHIAEEYAILYAILYIKKHAYERCHILCDNESAVNSKMVEYLKKDYGIGVSWIPREANEVADKMSRLEPTLKEKEWNLLQLFIDLVKKQCHNAKENEALKDQEIASLKEQIEKHKDKIKNQAQMITNLNKKLKG
jgi:alanyl-tRNA synthetase